MSVSSVLPVSGCFIVEQNFKLNPFDLFWGPDSIVEKVGRFWVIYLPPGETPNKIIFLVLLLCTVQVRIRVQLHLLSGPKGPTLSVR